MGGKHFIHGLTIQIWTYTPCVRLPELGPALPGSERPGHSAHATLRAVNVGNFPPATCTPTPVLGLRIYPPNQTAAAFIAQTGTGCAQAGVNQLQIGFVVNGTG